MKELLRKVKDYTYLIEKGVVGQKVPVVFYLSDELLKHLEEDAVRQALNASTLKGVVGAIYVMPDVHVGYGFPVGGVMATDPKEGVISPGAIGYDINCGVRLIATNLEARQILPKIKDLMRRILQEIPSGVGSTSKIKLSRSQLREVLKEGARWAISYGFGPEEDLKSIEDGGRMEGADPEEVSNLAYERGSRELGTVGSGNHFVELQTVEEIFDEEEANKLSLFLGQVLIMVHSGSRGLGHQVCTDYLRLARKVMPKYKVEVPDPQLSSLPFNSKEGQSYFKAMLSCANYAFANRQILGFRTAQVIKEFLGISWEELGYRLIYDHAHNIGKLENHKRFGKVLVHRKGATRSFPNQPVIIPGDMGRYSYLLLGQRESLNKSFGSACHGAGRLLSRRKAKELVKERGLERIIEGITVVARGKGTVAEEIPQAYKDVSEVVRVVEELGIAKVVARLKPIGTLKG